MLQELTSLPEGLLGLSADQLEAALGGPVLIHLPGKRPSLLFLSVLMHGNETVGWEAVSRLLKRYEGGRDLPRAISLFIGNVSAAALGLRRLPGQPDYNRVWPGSETDGTPEHTMMRQVTETIARLKPFVSVDVHNNTGLNPHYACVNRLDASFLHLANLFGRTVVYFLRPKGVQSLALAEICPAVTLECGKVGQARGVDHAQEYLDACLHLSEHPLHPVADQDIDLFHTVAQVKMPETLSFSFGDWEADILFAPDLDHMNFRELPRGTSLGRVLVDRRPILDVRDERGEDVTARFFAVEEGELRLRTPVMPSMLTTNRAVVRQDCLCYLMERYDTHLHERD
ncbi:MAG: peptidase M14 [endosymbiont of Seepiophila jonesi]|uniref:Peptidase M14 n=1 Tax=endosymbiont of Lamellibrachia luymesi TaxID=2200907 RepID=A0A370DUP6_9GAMM|nr:MAG: peptidase M14 [endosymbiont of Lamellibrachia luymesi]RDH91009.1 MAG: peptidase M14 [endosymbiont of Seepiophila jonesi]